MKPYKKRPVAVFKISKLRKYGDFRDKVSAISANIEGNTTLFATPVPTVAVVNAHIVEMDQAQTDVQLRKPGAVATRDTRVQQLVDDVGREWLGYVQNLADEVDYEAALIIITSAGYDVKVNGRYIKPDLRIMLTTAPGTIKLIAKSAGKRAAYEWQQSNNNGVSWTMLPVSNKATVTVSGLSPKTSYLFRFRSTVNNLTSGWSMVVSIVIQ